MTGSAARAWRNVFVVVFLALQLALPLRGFVYSKLESRGDFSWNMYSQQYSCRVRYLLQPPAGDEVEIDVADYTRHPDRLVGALRHDWLPPFHRWLCSSLEGRGQHGELRARVTCRHDFGRWTEMIEPYGVLCTITDEGVSMRTGGGGL